VHGVARHFDDIPREPWVAAASQLGLVNQGRITASLDHPYMEEVISEAEHHDVDRYVKVSRPLAGSGGGVGGRPAVGSGWWGHWGWRVLGTSGFLPHGNA